MKSINKNITTLYEIEKSKFYTFLIKVNCVDDVNTHLNKIKEEYKDATHYCYAYIIGPSKRCSDDGEPSGTAGMPILNVLEQNNLDYILCVVVRYFGGVKLGAGGLVRAYSKSVTTALDNTEIITLKEYYKISISFKYDNLKQINYLLKDIEITYKEYDEFITYEFFIETNNEETLKEELKNYVNSYNQKEKVLK